MSGKFNPIAWAFAIAILLVFGAIAFRIAVSCEQGKYSLFDQMKVELGGCTNASVNPPEVSNCEVIVFEANEYSKSKNIGVGNLTYGNVITNGGDGSVDQENMVEFTFKSTSVCNYRLEVEYAALKSRPVVISLNGKVVNQSALSETTGGWYLANQIEKPQGTLKSDEGLNRLKFYRSSVFPHIRSVRLVPL